MHTRLRIALRVLDLNLAFLPVTRGAADSSTKFHSD